MPIQINPSKFPIWVGENRLRLGVTDDSQVISPVSNAQERLIQLLFEGVSEDQLSMVGGSVGLSEFESSELVARLKPSLLNSSKTGAQSNSLDIRFAEIVRLGFETNRSPVETIAKRARKLIELPALDRTGLTLIRVLAELGFRKFQTTDYGTVSNHDGGELGYPKTMLGLARLTAIRKLMETENNQIEINHPTKSSPESLTIVAATHRLLPNSYESKTTVLGIEYGLSSVFVSGVTTRGQSPCLGCRDRWAAENKSGWVEESIQLTSRHDHLDDGISLLIASALAAKSVCAFTDGDSPTSSTEVDVISRNAREISFQFHPGCGCRN